MGGGRPKTQLTCNDVIRNFQRGSFYGAKLSQNGRSEAVVRWHLTITLVKVQDKNSELESANV